MIPKTVLITGASGLIGSQLTKMLLNEGHQVRHLSRNRKDGRVPSFVWDIDTGQIDERAFESVDSIIHLAGAGIADKRWTAKRKRQILESRTRSSQLLFEKLNSINHKVQTFISASAIGYYGFGIGIFTEESKPGDDFLADVVRQWEDEVDKIQSLNIRTVKIRTGIVLSAEGGALTEIARPIRYGVGAQLGSGKQHMSWIHLTDLCNMFLFALANDQMHGAYNAVSPTWTTNSEITKAIANVINRPLWLPAIPGFVLKTMLGEMADLILKGSKVSADKIQKTGFTFAYPNLDDALKNLLTKPNT